MSQPSQSESIDLQASAANRRGHRVDAPLRGIILILAALSVLILLDASGKWLGMQGIPVAATTWSRYVGHLILVILIFLPTRGRALFRSQAPIRQVLRGLMMVSVTMLFFGALKILPLAESTAIFFLSPILTTLFAMVFLREHAGLATWVSIFGGFVGVLIVVRPGSGELPLLGVLLVVAAAFGNATYQTLTRALSSADSPETQLLYSGLIGAVVMSILTPWLLPQAFSLFELTPTQALVLAGLGLLGGVGHLLLIEAFRAAAAPKLTPWMYMQLVLSVAIGFFVFGDWPDSIAFLGMALIALSPHVSRIRWGREPR